MPLILFFYLIRHFLKAIAIVALIISFAVIAVDLAEMLRKTSSANIPFRVMVSIVLSKLPYLLQELYPFLIFIAAIYSFFQLSKRSEYTIMKTSGISVWQFLLPYFAVSLILGVLAITILNPIASALLLYGEKVKSEGSRSGVAVTLMSSGFWLIDKATVKDMYVIVHTDRLLIEKDKAELVSPSFTYVSHNYEFIKRIKGQKAILVQNRWHLFNAVEYAPYSQSIKYDRYEVPTDVNLEELRYGFKEPRYISIWNLPYSISILQLSGYHAKQYITYFYKVLSKPFTTLSMLCIAAIFSLKPIRIFNPTYLILASLLAVFTMYFVIEIAFATLLNNHIMPPAIATALLILSVNMTGVFLLRYYKD